MCFLLIPAVIFADEPPMPPLAVNGNAGGHEYRKNSISAKFRTGYL